MEPVKNEVRTARCLAWFTIIYNIAEGIVSIVFGVADESISLLGFGLDSFTEVFSAFIILWRIGLEFTHAEDKASLERERMATRGIGILLILLAGVVLANSGLRFYNRVSPDTALPGIIISLASLAFMFYLYFAKIRVAAALNSKALKSDAMCSLACIWLSVVLLAGSGVYYLTRVWWVDSAAAVVIAFLILREGIDNVKNSLKPEFDGCCSCGGKCD